VAFTAKPELGQPLSLPAGTEVASDPVAGTRCRFRTCFNVDLLPLTLLDASFVEQPGRPPRIVLRYQLNGFTLSEWKTPSLRFFLGDGHAEACTFYLLLLRYLKGIAVTGQETGQSIKLPADCLRPGGSAADETMLVGGASASSGDLMLQEYFLFPDKYLFVDLYGLDSCRDLGSASLFDIAFELKPCPFPLPKVQQTSFILAAVPVINLFRHPANSLTVATGTPPQRVQPAGKKPEHYQIYSVDRITAREVGTAQVKHETSGKPYSQADDSGCCRVTHSAFPWGVGYEIWVSLESQKPGSHTVNVDLTCTNGSIPEKLGVGAITYPTVMTPETVWFTNIKPVTASIPPANGDNRLWKNLARFTINTLSWNGAANFRAVLRRYLPVHCRDQAANRERIVGIKGIAVVPADRLAKGRMLRGYEIRLTVCGDNYSGPGDVYLFCSVVNRFLGGFAGESCFVRLVVNETSNGYTFEFPTQFGGN
jgi:type VI secretion system protein ImpG